VSDRKDCCDAREILFEALSETRVECDPTKVRESKVDVGRVETQQVAAAVVVAEM